MSEKHSSKAFKVIFATFSVILLGALGSGLWEKLVSPFFDLVLKLSVSGMSLVFTSYKDGLYKSAAQGFHEEHSLLIYIFVSASMMSFYAAFLVILFTRGTTDAAKSPLRRIPNIYFPKHRVAKVIAAMLYGIMIVMLVFLMLRAAYSNKITTYSLNAIEIIAPYLDHHDLLLLKSEFLSVDSADSFYQFNNKLQSIANENDIQMPLFNAL